MCRDIRLWLASSLAINSHTQCSPPLQRRASAARRVGSQMAVSMSCIGKGLCVAAHMRFDPYQPPPTSGARGVHVDRSVTCYKRAHALELTRSGSSRTIGTGESRQHHSKGSRTCACARMTPWPTIISEMADHPGGIASSSSARAKDSRLCKQPANTRQSPRRWMRQFSNCSCRSSRERGRSDAHTDINRAFADGSYTLGFLR